MSEFLALLDVKSIVTTGGLLGVTAIVFAESGLFFGFFLPGDSLLFTAGFFASQGYFSIWHLILLSVFAAITGDSVGYWFGQKTGPLIFTREDSWLFSQKRVRDAHDFFDRHGAKSIILARFIPAVRTFTPIVAGVAGMRYRTFFLYNAIGGVLWGVGLPLLGYILGSSVPNVDQYLLPIVLVIIFVSFLPIIIPLVRERLRVRALKERPEEN